MSHELRTPLNAIIGFGEMMHREIMGPIGVPAYKEYAQHIHESGMHLLSLVEEMLDLAKVEAGKLQIERVPTRPGALLAESLMMLRSTRGDGRGRDRRRRGPVGLAGARRRPGQAKAGVRQFDRQRNQVHARRAGASRYRARSRRAALRIRIRDTGIGIRPQDIPLVVQPFYRVNSVLDGKHQGAGLGLPFAKSVVELHGGTLDHRKRARLRDDGDRHPASDAPDAARCDGERQCHGSAGPASRATGRSPV